ncbi:MAG: hypothetical protein ACR2PZ_25210, partial [Pseudomonadales bacterium]
LVSEPSQTVFHVVVGQQRLCRAHYFAVELLKFSASIYFLLGFAPAGYRILRLHVMQYHPGWRELHS